MSNNSVVYARLTEGTNAGNYASVTIADTTKPKITSATATSNSITLNATDSESGIVGYKAMTTLTAPYSFYNCTNTKALNNQQITGLSANTQYYLYVKDAAGNVSTSYSIKTSAILVTSITLNKTTLTLDEGSSETLTATISPTNATNKQVTWSTNKSSVAKVDTTGKITAVSAGTATITATAKDGSGKSASCTVTVSEKSNMEYVKYPIDLNGDGDTTNDWALFYKADGNADGEESGGVYNENVGDYYIIAADYLKNTDSRLKLTAIGATKGSNIYNIYWKKTSSIVTGTTLQKTGTENLTVNGKSRTINTLFMHSKYSLDQDILASKLVATLINTENWTGYVNSSYADYAIGSPTIEMFVASWNAMYADTLKLYLNSERYGYRLVDESGSEIRNEMSEVKGGYANNSLHFPSIEEKNGCFGYWTASPNCGTSEFLGRISYFGKFGNTYYENDAYSLRPVVHIKSGKTLTKNASGIWEIK